MRINIYSILIKNGFKLPSKWNIALARKEISDFMRNSIEMTDELKSALSLYTDKQWEKLIWRLHDNGHRFDK